MSQGVIHDGTHYIGVIAMLCVVQMIGFGRGK
jgi:hypothetical protein